MSGILPFTIGRPIGNQILDCRADQRNGIRSCIKTLVWIKDVDDSRNYFLSVGISRGNVLQLMLNFKRNHLIRRWNLNAAWYRHALCQLPVGR